MAAPANDNIADAEVLAPGTTQVSGLTYDGGSLLATVESGEVRHLDSLFPQAAHFTVWFRWTAPSTTNATFTTAGSTLPDGSPGYDTVLGVYRAKSSVVEPATTVTDVEIIASDDDAPGVSTSSVTITPEAGRTYYLQISSFDNTTAGTYFLNYPSPAAEPFLHLNRGTAARNGTTSHTINFGFTSTSGNMLAVIVYGGVTHAASGWTEQLSPVSSGELSVFTKTSAGDSSITVTHNGSDYPVPWVAYEFPAGSTWTGGTSSNNSAETLPTLSGLPGTAQLIIAARGRVAGSTAATASDAAWTSPFAEDADLFAAHNGSTDGAYLTVAHATGVTSTSVTPVSTTSYGGTWVVPDKQYVVFAIALGSGSSTTNGTATVTGAGSVTAAGTQIIRATASVTGTGSVTALATQRGAASATGAGTVSAAGSVRSTATVTGTGSVSATGSVRINGTATVAGVGTVSAAASQGAGATVTGVGSVTAGAGGVVNGTASVTGAGSVTAAAQLQAGAAIAGVGSVAAAATQAAGSSVTGTGSVVAGAGGVTNGTASVTGSGTVSALATQRGSATVTGAGTVTAAGSNVRLGTAAVVGAGSVTATVRQLAGATVVGTGQVSATSAGQITYGTASVMGQGFVTASSNSRITPRPAAGTTARPFAGVTPRP